MNSFFRFSSSFLYLVLCLSLALLGCDSGSDTGGAGAEGGSGGAGAEGGSGGAGAEGGAGGMAAAEAIEISGRFGDGAGVHMISAEQWAQEYEGSAPAVFRVLTVDNEGRYAIAQNAAENEFNPSLFSRFDWHWTNEGLYYCQSAYNAESAEEAANAPRPDDAEPGMSGCGGMFPWSFLTPTAAVVVQGDFTDSGMGIHGITQNTWSQTYGESTSHFIFTQVLTEENGEGGRLVAKNGLQNEFNPGLWSRFDWTLVDGSYWYCQSSYAAMTAEAALEEAAADDSDVANSGCGGAFAWSQLQQQAP